jgi:hypothetical protein
MVALHQWCPDWLAALSIAVSSPSHKQPGMVVNPAMHARSDNYVTVIDEYGDDAVDFIKDAVKKYTSKKI